MTARLYHAEVEDYEIVFKDGVEVRHFKDRWIGGKQSYLDWMRPRIRALHQVLKQTGSFYLHCDSHLNGYLREMCDTQFREGNFRNEIVWKRTSAHSGEGKIRKYGVVHDTILFYSKTTNIHSIQNTKNTTKIMRKNSTSRKTQSVTTH